jgi:hypothetical protein
MARPLPARPSPPLGPSARDASHGVRQGDTERVADPAERQERDVVLAPLDRPDVGPVQPALVGEFLLGPASRLADCPQVFAELAQHGVLRRHVAILGLVVYLSTLYN